jgi:uncharacterized membrane protein
MKMNKEECINEKWSSRTVGLLVLVIALPVAFIGSLIVPLLGLVFAVPLLLLSFVLIAAPESKVCRFIMRKDT